MLSVNKAKGFTLIELLIVIAIIAILATVGAVIYGNIPQKARDARRKVDIQAISNAWELRLGQTSPYYPQLDGSFFTGGALPQDPLNSGSYVYDYSGGEASPQAAGDNYKVCAALEEGGTYCQISQSSL